MRSLIRSVATKKRIAGAVILNHKLRPYRGVICAAVSCMLLLLPLLFLEKGENRSTLRTPSSSEIFDLPTEHPTMVSGEQGRDQCSNRSSKHYQPAPLLTSSTMMSSPQSQALQSNTSRMGCDYLILHGHPPQSYQARVRADVPFDMVVYQRGDVVSNEILRAGRWEPSESKRIASHFSDGRAAAAGLREKILLDLGANIGYFSALVSSRGHRVIAVEPYQDNMHMLLSTACTLNQGVLAARISAYNVALSDEQDRDMCLWPTSAAVNRGNAKLTPFFNGTEDWGVDLEYKQRQCVQRVGCVSLDSLLFIRKDGPMLSIQPWGMKIDVEGYETRILRGASCLLEYFPPCKIWFEHQVRAAVETGVGPREIFEILHAARYKISILSFNGVLDQVSGPEWGGCDVCDYEAEYVGPGCSD